MNNKTIVIRAVSSGLGLAIARELAATGVRLIMVSRDPARGAAARSEVAGVATGSEPIFLTADLSSQRSIRDLGALLHRRFAHDRCARSKPVTYDVQMAARLRALRDTLTGAREPISLKEIA
jgi:NAD(P)-dependent dehydrogenase (short-subunit alcohol dehydrogenase family)